MGDTVLDLFIESGITAIACIKGNRNYIGFEIDPKYFEIANLRYFIYKTIVKVRLSSPICIRG